MLFQIIVLLYFAQATVIIDDPVTSDYQFQEYVSYVTYMASNACGTYEDSLSYNNLSIQQDELYSEIYGESYNNNPTKAQQKRMDEIREQMLNLTADLYKCSLKGMDMIKVGYVATEKYTYREDSTLLEFIDRDDVQVDYYLIGTAYQPYGSTPQDLDEASDNVYQSFWNQTGESFQEEYEQYLQTLDSYDLNKTAGVTLTNSSANDRRLLQSFSSTGVTPFSDYEDSLKDSNVSFFWNGVPHQDQSTITVPVDNLKLNSYYNIGVNITWKENQSSITQALLYFNTVIEREISLMNISDVLKISPKVNRQFTKWMKDNNRLTINGSEVGQLFDPINIKVDLSDSSYDNVDRVYLIVLRTAMYYDDPIWFKRTAETTTYQFCTFNGNVSACPWDDQPEIDTSKTQDVTDMIVEGIYKEYPSFPYESVKLGQYIEYFEINSVNRTGSYDMMMPFLYSGQNYFQVGLYLHYKNGTETRGYDWFFVEGPTFPYVEQPHQKFAYSDNTDPKAESSTPDYGCGENDRCNGKGTCLRTQMTCKCFSEYGGHKCDIKSEVAKLKQQYLQQQIDRLEQKEEIGSDSLKAQLLNLSNSEILNSSQAIQLQKLISSNIDYIQSPSEADAFLYALQQLFRIQRQHFIQDYYIQQPEIITQIGSRMLAFLSSGAVESAQDDFTTKTSILSSNATNISFLYPLVINGRIHNMPTITIPANIGAAGVTLSVLNPFVVQRVVNDPIAPILTVNLLDKDGEEVQLNGQKKILFTICPSRTSNISDLEAVWWNSESLKLDTVGCEKTSIQSNEDCLTFQCNHLTMFTLRSKSSVSDASATIGKSNSADESQTNYVKHLALGLILIVFWL